MPMSKPAVFTKSWTGLGREGSQAWCRKGVGSAEDLESGCEAQVGMQPPLASLESMKPGSQDGRVEGGTQVPALPGTHSEVSAPCAHSHTQLPLTAELLCFQSILSKFP